MIFDVFFLIDMHIVTHTSYLSQGVLIWERDRILKHHGRLSLIIHFIASIPLSWAGLFTSEWWHYLLLACPRLLRVKRAMSAMDSFKRLLVYDSWASAMVPLLTAWLLLVHFFACLFYLCAWFEGFDEAWVGVLGWDYLTPPQLYVVSAYFLMVTMFNTGTGDITPQTSAETILVIFMQLIGVSTVAFIVGLFVSRLIDAIGEGWLYRYYGFADFINFKKIETPLHQRIYEYFEHDWETNHGTEDPNHVYRLVPETIRNHLKRDMCDELLRKVSIFQVASENFRMNIAKILKFIEFVPDEEIIREGEISPDLLLLNTGVIDVYMDRVKFATVQCSGGMFFGEQELLMDYPRSSTVFSRTHVSGFRLSREELQVAVGSKEELKTELLNIVRMLFPDFHGGVKELLSPRAIGVLMTQGTSDSEYGSDDVGVALQGSTDSDG
jgi:hypothetical protein